MTAGVPRALLLVCETWRVLLWYTISMSISPEPGRSRRIASRATGSISVGGSKQYSLQPNQSKVSLSSGNH